MYHMHISVFKIRSETCRTEVPFCQNLLDRPQFWRSVSAVWYLFWRLIFNRYRHSLATATPVKYEFNSKDPPVVKLFYSFAWFKNFRFWWRNEFCLSSLHLWTTCHVEYWISSYTCNLCSAIKWFSWILLPHMDGLVQDCSISSVLTMEILQSCTEPSI